jgi:hypothetical protein
MLKTSHSVVKPTAVTLFILTIFASATSGCSRFRLLNPQSQSQPITGTAGVIAPIITPIGPGIDPSSLQKLFFKQTPSHIFSGIPVSPEPILQIQDGNGNAVASKGIVVTLAAFGDAKCSANPLLSQVSFSASTAITDANGTAKFPGIIINSSVTSIYLQATSGSTSVCSSLVLLKASQSITAVPQNLLTLIPGTGYSIISSYLVNSQGVVQTPSLIAGNSGGSGNVSASTLQLAKDTFGTLQIQYSDPTGAPNQVAFKVLGNPGLWLDASNSESTSLDSNNKIQWWKDKGGSGALYSQLDANLRPSHVSNALNGNPVIQFDGTQGQYLFGVSQPPLDTITNGSTFFVVGQAALQADSASNTFVSNGPKGLALSVSNKAGNLALKADVARMPNIAVDRTRIPQGYQLMYATYDGGQNGNGKLFISNGSVLKGISDPVATGKSFANVDATSTSTYIGKAMSGGGTLTGNIAEILIFPAVLTAPQIAQVVDSLQAKYAMKASYWSYGNASYCVNSNSVQCTHFCGDPANPMCKVNRILRDSNGSYTDFMAFSPPADIDEFVVSLIGGGSGGEFGPTCGFSASPGGYGGAFASAILSAKQSDLYSVRVGAGGNGAIGTCGNPGGAGGIQDPGGATSVTVNGKTILTTGRANLVNWSIYYPDNQSPSYDSTLATLSYPLLFPGGVGAGRGDNNGGGSGAGGGSGFAGQGSPGNKGSGASWTGSGGGGGMGSSAAQGGSSGMSLTVLDSTQPFLLEGGGGGSGGGPGGGAASGGFPGGGGGGSSYTNRSGAGADGIALFEWRTYR